MSFYLNGNFIADGTPFYINGTKIDTKLFLNDNLIWSPNEEVKIMAQLVLNKISYHGRGCIADLPNEITKRNFQKALICVDPDFVKFDYVQNVTSVLATAGISYELYSDIKSPYPTIESIQHGVETYKQSGADCIIAFGGANAMSAAKAIGIVITNPEYADIRSLEGVANTRNESAPIFAVPAECTAEEITYVYKIKDAKKSRIMLCLDVNALPIMAFVDSDLFLGEKTVIAQDGMYTLCNAIEGYLTKGAWEMTDMFCLKAIQLIADNLHGAVAQDANSLEKIALAQYISGMGWGNAGVGLANAMAEPLVAIYDMPKGVACGILLPAVMEYNAPVTGEKYKDIAKAMGLEGVDSMGQDEYRKAAIDGVKRLSADVGIPESLKEYLKAEDISYCAQSAANGVYTSGNPRETSEEEIAQIYRALL